MYDYILGYSAANDVSSRDAQFGQSQWCFSKGFDGSCPLGKSENRYLNTPGKVDRDLLMDYPGPVIASAKLIPDPHKLRLRGIMNDKVMQESGTE